MESHNNDEQYFLYTGIYVFIYILPDDGLPRPKLVAKTNTIYDSCVWLSTYIFYFILILYLNTKGCNLIKKTKIMFLFFYHKSNEGKWNKSLTYVIYKIHQSNLHLDDWSF
jgi:hypothetical protein